MALRLELVAGIFARGRHAGEAGEPAGAAEAELDHRLELVDVDPADPAAIPARLDRRLDADVDRAPNLGRGRGGGRAAARRLLRLRFGQAFGEDRKSGVSGKSVSERVDHGGRRILKKTKQTNQA